MPTQILPRHRNQRAFDLAHYAEALRLALQTPRAHEYRRGVRADRGRRARQHLAADRLCGRGRRYRFKEAIAQAKLNHQSPPKEARMRWSTDQ
jgi:hypothetical protein